MPRIAYQDWNPTARSLDLIRITNEICLEMKSQGYDLTLRQTYYQFVARGYIENSQRSYANLGELINKGRLAGFVDWNYIVDRTRNMQTYAGLETPEQVIRQSMYQLRPDRWEGQDYRVEVWVEKEALVGVVQRAAYERRIPFFACRGYVSQSELHAAARRHIAHEKDGQQVIVIHLGDHDPSGIDMTRDIQDRLELFGANTQVRRIALNMDQVDEFNPPPNPAKLTDSRAGGYIAQHGRSSWELDALKPQVIHQLILDEVDRWIEQDVYDGHEAREEEGRELLERVADQWDDVVENLDD